METTPNARPTGGGTATAADGPKLRVERFTEGPITLLKLGGTIDEQFDGKMIAQQVKGGILILHLGEIDRISSFGIREWVDFIVALKAKVASMWFVECAPKVVDQFNMVANFGGDGHLVSFYAPYRCDYCDDDRRRLVRVREEWEQVRAGKMPERTCEACGNPEYFDEDPLTFFSYLQQRQPVEVPPEIEAFLASKLNYAAGDGARKLKIEKQIDGRATYLKLSGDLDKSLPSDKLAEGLEGDVIFDLSSVGKIDPAGAAEWRLLMARIAAPVERILLVGCPAAFVERLTKSDDLAGKGMVLSFTMPYSCASCRSTTAREVDVAQSFEVLRAGTVPELPCPDCKKPTSCVASEALLAHLPTLPKPELNEELRRQVARFREEALKQALAARAPAGAAVPSLPAASGAGRGVARGGAPWMSVLAAVGTVIVLAGGFFVYQGMKARRTGADVTERLEASQPTRPAWVDQTFFREPERLLFVGRSTLVADKADGFTEAENGALDEVANQIGLSIRDPLWIDHVHGQYDAFRQKLLGDLEKAREAGDAGELERARRAAREARRRVADSLRKTSGGLAPTERNDLYWEKLQTNAGVRYQVWIRYAIPKPTFEKLVEAYAAQTEAMGAKAVSYFPQLAWRYDVAEGAIVVKVSNESALRFAGIQEGDLVLSGMDRVVHDARSWKRVLEEETAALARAPSGGALVLKVKRGDAPAIDTRMRIAAGGAAGADPTNRFKRTRPTGAPSTASSSTKGKNQTGNIWDDNPEE
jgi:anti-anti-sigma regulatory factor